ncbi:hypothetical protein X566_22795 [Afipia sp. P52-10]|jgi:hypothetical protein|uniref:hypothetical protein n=1 Tax=Afipia sp. P52-10 TaxID=1429916 RepID=UPI0003DF114B|nr:hypothetical protein [Afipia sp. P52-10]ETR75527.1 hypothetical protein X566_22795 [Afipia sp. P52-10]
MAYRSDQHDRFLTPAHQDQAHNDDPAASLRRFEDESATSGRRVAIYAVAVIALVAALIYGMTTDTGTNTTAQKTPGSITAQRVAVPPAPIRDVTPRSNSEPGMTTGAAPVHEPAMAPAETSPNSN